MLWILKIAFKKITIKDKVFTAAPAGATVLLIGIGNIFSLVSIAL